MKRQYSDARGERGMMLIFAGFGIVAFMAATMLALDVGMIMVARTQAQNAADSGALAGAVALVYDDFNDRTPDGPAVQNAIAAATSGANSVMKENVSVQTGDVTFPELDRVQVSVHRTTERGNPLTPFLAPMIGINTINMGAVAVARAAPANAMTCVKPFTIPDKWVEMQTPPWDPDDTFDVVDNQGRPLANPDIYIPATDKDNYTGYNSWDDRGTQVVIKPSNGNNLFPSFYFPYTMDSGTGADNYEWNISHCNTTMMKFDQVLTAEPGNMVGPTVAGIKNLIDQDPLAYYDHVNKKVVSNMKPSPRVVPIPVFDPIYYDTGKQNGRWADLKTANYIGIFIDRMQGNNVIAYITPVGGILTGDGPAPEGAFPMAIVLVK